MKIINYIKETVKFVLLVLLIAWPIRSFRIQPFYVKGASMEPNFYEPVLS
jgi:signal peptidase I